MKQSNTLANGFIKAFVDGAKGLLVIDNPQRKNAITAAMWRAIPDAIHWLHAEAGAAEGGVGGEQDDLTGALRLACHPGGVGDALLRFRPQQAAQAQDTGAAA